MTQAAAPGHAVPVGATTGRPRLVVTSAIGIAQILAWGSSYYLTAVLAGPVAKDTGWVGKEQALGGVHPCRLRRARQAPSTLYRQGENRCTWPQSRGAVPTDEPASKMTGSRPRSRRCAAAAKPTGPPPMMATGNLARSASWRRVAPDDACEQHEVISDPFSVGINA
jgi:hypothetical protein